MKKESTKNIQHISVTMDRLMLEIFTQEELDLIFSDPDHSGEHLSSRSRWIRTSDLAVPEVNTEKMALIHLLWLQAIQRIVIEDIDSCSGAVRVRLNLAALKKRKKIRA